MKKFFNNIKIEKKILLVFSSLLILTQLFMGSIACLSIFRINSFSDKEMQELSSNTIKIGESLTQNQIEDYLKNLSYSTAEGSNSIFEEVSNQVSSASEGIHKIYENNNNFKGYIPPLPEFNQSDLDKNAAFHKAYALDTSIQSNTPLVYNIPDYSNYSKKIYKTSVDLWSSLEESIKNEILDNYSVVSENNIPSDLYKEMLLLSNAGYILEPIFKSNTCVSSIYIGTESGLFYEYSPDSTSKRYDHRLRPWYISAKEADLNNSPVWHSTYISNSTGKLCITCSKSFTDSKNNVLGVCAIDMYLDDISKYITKSNVGESSYNFILDNNGVPVITPSNDSNPTSTYPTDLPKELTEKILSENNGILTLELDGKEYYAGYASLPATNWTLCSIVQKDEAIKPVSEIHSLVQESAVVSEYSMKKHFLFVILQFVLTLCVCLVITYFVALKLSKSISKPITELSKKTKSIGSGNFSVEISVDSEDEVGELANCFNTMTKNLKTYMDNLTKTVAEKEKIHSELLIAKKIQKSMLPCIFPAFPERTDLDIYALMDPAKEVGGDFYDFFFIDEKHLALVIADVSDKGVSAALFMVISKILIKNQLQNGNSPAEVFEIINNRLCENNEAGMFVTCFLGILDIENGEFIYANAGHNPPILYNKSEKKYNLISDPHGFVLGAVSNLKYTQDTAYLHPGDMLLLYTDGVTEAINNKGELFSQERLEKIAFESMNKNVEVNNLVLNLRSEIEKFSNGAERSDDITILAFKNFNISPPINEEQKLDDN